MWYCRHIPMALIVLQKCDFISYISTRMGVSNFFVVFKQCAMKILIYKFLAMSLIISLKSNGLSGSKGRNFRTLDTYSQTKAEKWGQWPPWMWVAITHLTHTTFFFFFIIANLKSGKNWSRPIFKLKSPLRNKWCKSENNTFSSVLWPQAPKKLLLRASLRLVPLAH